MPPGPTLGFAFTGVMMVAGAALILLSLFLVIKNLIKKLKT